LLLKYNGPLFFVARLTLVKSAVMFSKSILATHVGGFRDPLAGRDPQFEKHCMV